MISLTEADRHGVVEYKTLPKLIFCILCFTLSVGLFGYFLYVSELGNGGLIQTYQDATWTVLMSMSTIGFGDFYPITLIGRIVVFVALVAGAVNFGFLISILSGVLGTDTGVQNRELRTMLSETMRKLEHMEDHLDMDTSITKDSHNLDYVIAQVYYESNLLTNGWLTAGQDSSGVFFLSIEAYCKNNGRKHKQWIPADSRRDLLTKFKRFKGAKNEL